VKAKRFLWAIIPASGPRDRNGRRPLCVAPFPKGSELTDDILFSDPDQDVVWQWLEDYRAKEKPKRPTDTRTQQLFEREP